MIRYTVRCDSGHDFEAWFASIAEYERQEAAGEVCCPTCGSTKVERAPMAPAIGAGVNGGRGEQLQHTGRPGCPACAAARRRLLKKIPSVEKFPEHVRAHPQEAVRGDCTMEEAEELRAEGFPVFGLPPGPEDMN